MGLDIKHRAAAKATSVSVLLAVVGRRTSALAQMQLLQPPKPIHRDADVGGLSEVPTEGTFRFPKMSMIRMESGVRTSRMWPILDSIRIDRTHCNSMSLVQPVDHEFTHRL